jgi:quercetin dioxygenase-like cupin family protein
VSLLDVRPGDAGPRARHDGDRIVYVVEGAVLCCLTVSASPAG